MTYPPRAVMPPNRKDLTPDELQRHLWGSAELLRGAIDAGDYKLYVFALLFLKRLSDHFDEERPRATFFVPPCARWEVLRSAASPGEALNTACIALEDENPRLRGVLAGLDFNDARRLGDAKNRDALLSRLLRHFSELDLGDASLSEPDVLGKAYEYLVERFADDAGKKAGEFRTPTQVVDLVVALCNPEAKMRICDPTCGSGGMLLGCARYVTRNGGDASALRLHGQERNLATWSICTMNLLLQGRLHDRIEKGDTIRDPRLIDERGRLLRFDRVLANPPFSLARWGQEVALCDPHDRFRHGVPQRANGDFAFIQHIVATLDVRGQAIIVVPHGVLFRGGVEADIRRQLLAEDLFEAVIGLPPNLFYGTGIPAAVLVLNRAKRAERKGKILFIDASRHYEERPARNRLRPEDIDRIVQAFRAFSDVPRYAQVIALRDIADQHFLNISRYVDASEPNEPLRPNLGAAIARLRELETARAVADARLQAVLRDLGYDG
ncbi:type I restriction-modification system subunit M [Chondromyces crocatus]|uniref:site-specific DNA-methyltransferase (adenine-specific) n=1 Tax=Chondromyces crocatus TaxID=52 RepID=A0A0K1EPY9_CHOCO|nr:class I SAM-dependent DNA methyltransferase [Chondromyces crocatus]AKT42916.1 DNA methyltransferase [Chondromyces crocatus]